MTTYEWRARSGVRVVSCVPRERVLWAPARLIVAWRVAIKKYLIDYG